MSLIEEKNILNGNFKDGLSNLKEIKIALIGDADTQLLNQALCATAFEAGYELEILEADFSQLMLQTFDPASGLYAFNPEVVIIFKSSHKLLHKYNNLKVDEQGSMAANEMVLIERMNAALVNQLHTKVIYYNYPEINDAVFGNCANKIASSFLFQLRKLNYELMEFAAKHPDFFLCDVSSIQNEIGKSNLFDTSVYTNTEMVLSMNALPRVATHTIDLLNALKGKFNKCVILDLDNTTWGGVIGDDGIENILIGSQGIGKAFSEFQYWIKKLKNRGIIVAVCSKNTEDTAKEPFVKHPDMVLRLDDIAVFIANGENKADNIMQIKEILNIGYDTMVFLDDNPLERNMVREHLPEITVPELPEDPAAYLEYLYGLNLFETVSYSREDEESTARYQVELQRSDLKRACVHENEFLKRLGMVSIVEPFNKFNTPRVAQLSQRSNQFNLRTVRYTEEDVRQIASSKDYFTFSFTLADKFGNNGVICAVILKKQGNKRAFIDSWFMSCRVLKRSMEKFVLNTITAHLKEQGYDDLIGEYIPSSKNGLVKDHFQNLGFMEVNNQWKLDLNHYDERITFITNHNG